MDTMNDTTKRPAPTFGIGEAVAMANEPKRAGIVIGHRWNEQLDEWTVKVTWDGYILPEWDDELGGPVQWQFVRRNGRPAVSMHCEVSLVRA